MYKTLGDAEVFSLQHFESEAALNQVSYADIIVLNKTDLAVHQQVDMLEAWVREQKWGAQILRSQNSQIPLPLILDTNLFQPERYAAEAKVMAEATHDHDHHAPHSHDHHYHSSHLINDGFVSVAFESDRPFDLDKFQDWLADDLSENVFRAKGFLWFGTVAPRYIFQLSGKRYTLDADKWPAAPKTQLVLIGYELDAPKLQHQLWGCLTSYSHQ